MSLGFVVDNGGETLKVGLSTNGSPICMPNAVMRTGTSKQVFVGNEMISSGIESSYAPAKWWKRPIDRGVVTDWGLQQKIWDRGFHLSLRDVPALTSTTDQLSFEDFTLLYTQAPLCPPMLQNVSQEVAFELYGFDSIYRCSPSSLVLYNQRFKHPETASKFPCSIVIDSGYSFTHIMPFIGNQVIPEGIKRINVGGKLMDNYLKEVISFRQWNVMEETFLMKHIKEKLSFVSLDFARDLSIAKHSQEYVAQWVLPSSKGEIGHLRNEQTAKTAQMLRMNNERFTVPELLFNPMIIGAQQAGIAESVVQAVNSCPEEMQEALYANILLCGGNTGFQNYKARIYAELRSLIPEDFALNVSIVEDPTTAAWKGGALLQQDSQYENMCATKQQYNESGHLISNLFTN